MGGLALWEAAIRAQRPPRGIQKSSDIQIFATNFSKHDFVKIRLAARDFGRQLHNSSI